MGVLVEGLCEKMVEVRRVLDGVVSIVVVFEEDVLSLICRYSPLSGRSLEEKQSFYDKLKCEWDMLSAGDVTMLLGDFNGHVGRHVDVFNWVQGGFGVGYRNLDERMLLNVLSGEEIMCVKYMV